MNDTLHEAPNALSQQSGRPVWTAPVVVSFLAIDQTANNTAAGGDGRGSSTAS